MTAVPVGEARNHLSELLGEIERTHERLTITRHGRPVAVLLSPDDLESLEETLDLLSSPGALDAVREGDFQIASGQRVSLEDIRSEFGGG